MCSCKNHNRDSSSKKSEVKKTNVIRTEIVKYKTVLIDKKVRKLTLEYSEN